jgi:predicted dehydrogenase
MQILSIGTGSIGQRHIANLQGLVPSARFVLARTDARMDAYAQSIDAEVFGSVDEALAHCRPDIAIVANPSSDHCASILSLLRGRIPSYVEKPVVVSREQADSLEAFLTKLSALPPCLMGCNLRFLPSLVRLKDCIQAGMIGQPVRAQMQVGQWLPDWRPRQDYRKGYSADPKRGGGVVLDLIHELDMARFLFGEFEYVTALGGKYSALEIASEDAAAVLLGRTGGPVVSAGLDYVARKPVRRYEIIGDGGSLEWDLFARQLLHHTTKGTVPIACGEGAFDMGLTYLAAMRQLLDAIRNGGQTGQDLAEGLATARLAIRANEMIRK